MTCRKKLIEVALRLDAVFVAPLRSLSGTIFRAGVWRQRTRPLITAIEAMA
jgi:hypothetical protein